MGPGVLGGNPVGAPDRPSPLVHRSGSPLASATAACATGVADDAPAQRHPLRRQQPDLRERPAGHGPASGGSRGRRPAGGDGGGPQPGGHRPHQRRDRRAAEDLGESLGRGGAAAGADPGGHLPGHAGHRGDAARAGDPAGRRPARALSALDPPELCRADRRDRRVGHRGRTRGGRTGRPDRRRLAEGAAGGPDAPALWRGRLPPRACRDPPLGAHHLRSHRRSRRERHQRPRPCGRSLGGLTTAQLRTPSAAAHAASREWPEDPVRPEPPDTTKVSPAAGPADGRPHPRNSQP